MSSQQPVNKMTSLFRELGLLERHMDYASQVNDGTFELMLENDDLESLIDEEMIPDPSDRQAIVEGFKNYAKEKADDAHSAQTQSAILSHIVPNIPVAKRKYVVQVFKWPLNIGTVVRSSMKKLGRTTGTLPEHYFHVGVVVYNTLHHFNGHGLQQHLEMPGNHKCRKMAMKTTEKTRNEFDHWLHDNSHRFTSNTYDFSSNNCISFAEAVCEFLGVEFDEPEVNELQTWLKKKTDIIHIVIKAINDNPVMKAFKATGVFLSSGSSKKNSMESVRETMSEIVDDIVKSSGVVDAIEAQFTLSKTGGILDKELGTIVDSP